MSVTVFKIPVWSVEGGQFNFNLGTGKMVSSYFSYFLRHIYSLNWSFKSKNSDKPHLLFRKKIIMFSFVTLAYFCFLPLLKKCV